MSPDESGDSLFRSLDVLARSLHVEDAGLEPALQAIVTAAVDTVSAAQYAGVIVISQGKLVPQAVSGRPALVLDQLQQKLGDGPCIQAAQRQALICIDDMHGEDRWPEFAAGAVAAGVHSMLCVPLWVHQRCLGTLSLFAGHAKAFARRDERITGLFATLAAIALAEAQRTDQLRAALDNRDLIGQAKGILMERYRITGEVAFGYLSRASQNVNLKLAEVARHLAETGELADAPRQPDR